MACGHSQWYIFTTLKASCLPHHRLPTPEGEMLSHAVPCSTVLCCVVQEWHIFGISTSTWRLRVLAPMNELRSSPLEHILMAVTGVRGTAWCCSSSTSDGSSCGSLQLVNSSSGGSNSGNKATLQGVVLCP